MTDNSAEQLIYLYGIVGGDAEAPGDDLAGLDGGAVELVVSGKVAGIISPVSDDVYNEDTLNGRLDDLAWVGERGVAHERVIDWFSERGPVIPLSMFSLHSDADTVARRLAKDEASLMTILDRLRGRREWGIRLWRGAGAEEGIDDLSPSLKALNAEIEAAPEGRKFLLERKRDQMRTEELRTASKRLAHELYGTLGAAAVDSERVPVAGASGGGRTLLLDAAFLVEDERFDDFQEAVNLQAARFVDTGFEIEFTGPWPPYHFARTDHD